MKKLALTILLLTASCSTIQKERLFKISNKDLVVKMAPIIGKNTKELMMKTEPLTERQIIRHANKINAGKIYSFTLEDINCFWLNEEPIIIGEEGKFCNLIYFMGKDD